MSGLSEVRDRVQLQELGADLRRAYHGSGVLAVHLAALYDRAPGAARLTGRAGRAEVAGGEDYVERAACAVAPLLLPELAPAIEGLPQLARGLSQALAVFLM